MALQFELSPRSLIGLYSDGQARPVTWESGPPPRIDGYVVGLTASNPGAAPRHAGERHPDADEVLFLISGQIDVVIEDETGAETVSGVAAGQGIVIPRGAWHRIVTREPSQLLHITPGPQGEWRPVARD